MEITIKGFNYYYFLIFYAGERAGGGLWKLNVGGLERNGILL